MEDGDASRVRHVHTGPDGGDGRRHAWLAAATQRAARGLSPCLIEIDLMLAEKCLEECLWERPGGLPTSLKLETLWMLQSEEAVADISGRGARRPEFLQLSPEALLRQVV